MRKNIFLLILTFLLTFSEVTAFASTMANQNVGIILIGGDSFETERHFKAAQDIFKDDKNISVLVGDEMQKKYFNYCDENGLSKTEALSLSDLITFTQKNNFDKILYLVMPQPTVERFYNLLGKELDRVSVQVNAYLLDDKKLLKNYSVTKKREVKDDGFDKRSPEVRANIAAFRLCIDDIKKSVSNSEIPTKVSENQNKRHIGVVVIGNPDSKAPDYYGSIKSNLKSKKNPDVVIEVGDTVQSKYMAYWAEKGFLSEQEPTIEEMKDFTLWSGYDKVLYLVMGDFIHDRYNLKPKNFLQSLVISNVTVTSGIFGFYASLYDRGILIKELPIAERTAVYNHQSKLDLKINTFRECVYHLKKEFLDLL